MPFETNLQFLTSEVVVVEEVVSKIGEGLGANSLDHFLFQAFSSEKLTSSRTVLCHSRHQMYPDRLSIFAPLLSQKLPRPQFHH